MKHLKLSLTDKNYYLLQRIAKADDRRLNDLIYLVFSTGLSSYFCERSIYFEKDQNEITIEEKAQIKKNQEIIKNNDKFWQLEDDEQKKLGYEKVSQSYSNCYNQGEKDFIDKLADEIRNNALKLIKEDYKEIEENIIKENTLKQDTEYCLVNGTNKKSIVNGNTWNESEVKNND